jgi:hypothetical protein
MAQAVGERRLGLDPAPDSAEQVQRETDVD